MMITIGKKTQCLKKWCQELGLNYNTIWYRINRDKWPVLKALELIPPTPIIEEIIENRINYDLEKGCWNYTGCLNSFGYGKIEINKKTVAVHRIMYKTFYGNIPSDKPCILHHCDNPKCCNPMHLYAGTTQDNVNDRVKRNRSANTKGENNGRSKLTEKQVLEIRASDDPNAVLAKRYNVTIESIYHIKNRIAWKHLK